MTPSLKTLFRAAAVVLWAGSSGATALAAAPAAVVSAALADPGRPATDTVRDATRHPAQLLAFSGVKRGDRVADLIPESGYFTRLFAKVVGPQGQVYAVVPEDMAKKAPKVMLDPTQAIAASPGYANVSVLVQPIDQLSTPQPLDVAWTSQNYHDIYGFHGADAAQAMDAAVFKALKPGGVFVVVDHAAAPGAGGTVAATLHRIEPETVKAQALAAGFRLESESQVLRNPADSHALKVFDPSIRGHTDQFVYKFRKPAA